MHQESRAWIPPEPLIFAQAALLFSWIALFFAGSRGVFGVSPLGLAWVHAVVLGWLTTTALAFLIHVLPGFTDVGWRYERLARGTLWLFQIGIVILITGFAAWLPPVVEAGGAIVTISVAFFLLAFFATIVVAIRNPERATRAVARALAIVAAMLGIAAALGLVLAIDLNHGSAFVASWAAIHAMLGMIGWLALLVAGVSIRTYNRLVRRENRRRSHIATSALSLLGLFVWITGELSGVTTLAVIGGAILAIGALLYLISTIALLRRASMPHRLPREFISASAFWLAVTIGFGIAAVAGRAVPAAFAFALLLGWIGQNVNAHLMHVGIRLISTLVTDDADETEPRVLLDRRLGVASFVAYQAAVGCGIVGLTVSLGSLLQVSAILGICGMAAMSINAVIASRKAAGLRAAKAIV